MASYEESDKHRSLTATIHAWVHHIDSIDTIIEDFTKTYTEEGNGPFTNIRNQWIYEKSEVIIKMLTNGAIQIFVNYGITGPAGGAQKNASFNWKYKILHAIFDYTPGCADADITLYKEIQKRLASYKQQIATLEARRDELLKLKERTDDQINELRDIRNKLERLFRIERGDIEQIDRLKERCPGIEEYK